MALTAVPCVEFIAKLTSPKSVIIKGGDTPSQASNQQYSNDNPSKKLCDEVLTKLRAAINSGQSQIPLNIVSGNKIAEDTSFVPDATIADTTSATKSTAKKSAAKKGKKKKKDE